MKNNSHVPQDAAKYLEQIAAKRIGGAINLRGIHFQVLYSAYTILSHLTCSKTMSSIRLEGIEDIDVNGTKLSIDENIYIQLKTSQNKLNASSFWEMGVLQNFLEVFIADPSSRFKLVHNMGIAQGHLAALADHRLDETTFRYWEDRLKSINNYGSYSSSDFLNAITFERKDIEGLYKDISSLLLGTWKINKGTEAIFLRTLFYHIFDWSIDRKVIINEDLSVLFTEITDSFSKAPSNLAIKHEWISLIDYSLNKTANLEGYFDGKACRPAHIANNLPARRKKWEKLVWESLKANDITVIRSSSGQGKSTIAWQVGFNSREEYTIYQLNTCRNMEEVNSLTEFIASRVCLGTIPLIILDGLNIQTKEWGTLAERTAGLPVKFMVTSRYEDWQRYGADVSRLGIQIIDIFLTQSEAHDIFLQLKARGKINPSVISWEPAWESVHRDGLLIEYTVLLTSGQMIEDRLRYQLNTISLDNSAAAKLEILRLVALSDLLQLSIRTESLLDYIKKEIGFDTDREIVLNFLENEYFISFSSQYIVGLHPVRSKYLNELLNRHSGTLPSLIRLYDILQKNQHHEFFANTQLLLTEDEKNDFYTSFAQKLADGNWSEMVTAMDGIIHGEPQRYWLDNMEVFDGALKAGGIEIFIIESTPFSKVNVIEDLADSLSEDMAPAFKAFAERRKKLGGFSIKDTDVYHFAQQLGKSLHKRKKIPDSVKGIEFLVRWFDLLEVDFDFEWSYDNLELLAYLEQNDLEDSKDLFAFLQLRMPDAYKKFVSEHRGTIMSLLKVKTDSIRIYENGNNLHINYILSHEDVGEANNLSVKRITDISQILPGYECYCTDVEILPYPNLEIVKYSRDNAHKTMPPQNIGNAFDVHLNKIWISVISSNYQASSAFEWQAQLLELRKTNLDFVMDTNKYIDLIFEGKGEKAMAHGKKIDLATKDLSNRYATREKYPNFNRSVGQLAKFTTEQRIIDKWFSPMSNVWVQIPNLFLSDDAHKKKLVLINFKEVFLDLKKMQAAFATIEEGSHVYFETSELISKELEAYQRLYHGIVYVLEHPLHLQKPVAVGRKAIAAWWEESQSLIMGSFRRLFTEIEKTGKFKFYLPSSFRETHTLTYVTFGVEGGDLSDPENIRLLLMYISPLSHFPADFFTIVNVVNGTAKGAFRVQKEMLIELDKIMDEKEGDISNYMPLPVAVEEQTIELLPGVSLPLIDQNAIIELIAMSISDLWKLNTYRKSLDISYQAEEKWLAKLEKNIGRSLHTKLAKFSHPRYRDFISWINIGLQDKSIYHEQDYAEKIIEMAKDHVEK
ncbi:hypothetical protein [Pedobacter roseus]|uniref:Uncharacterized protein n=1 Tax=Pedobacter roseus TaxID=336820 RepID=A0A7G9QMC2_9SPHI|nr:hypothetical protein [Pedobacter roseus]QNN44497.1 hypothetical protein H9L23_10660 [Pedobacter roseus]